jgi:hypothetical protein
VVCSLVGLTILATITPVTVPFCRIQASQNEPIPLKGLQDRLKPSALVKDQEQALVEFIDTYRLAPGQNIERIPPPRPKGIHLWHQRKEPRLGAIGGLHNARVITFTWREPDELRVSSSMFGRAEGWTIRELPRGLNMGIYSYEIEGDPELLKTEVGGDWIVREGVPAEQLIQPLEIILQRAIRRRITLTLRMVEREVVIARGRYHPSPLPGHVDGDIEVYARELAQGDERGGGVGDFPSFLRYVAERIRRPILNEVESGPKGNIQWHSNGREALAKQAQHADGNVALVLKHLQEQTGLTFATERRPIRILFVERTVASK